MFGHARMGACGLAVRVWIHHLPRLPALLRADQRAQCEALAHGRPVAAVIAWHTHRILHVLIFVVPGLEASASRRIQRAGCNGLCCHARVDIQHSQVRHFAAL